MGGAKGSYLTSDRTLRTLALIMAGMTVQLFMLSVLFPNCFLFKMRTFRGNSVRSCFS